ncbi:hypothetical protein GCM10025861_26020 [Methanobacterium petrolearium]|nr:hypothetical protein GCM10025861_02080 [Methanobacterium petrolearium]BDZ69798.1 hypothetical protein GCM10025861_03150 [Methanobacterium petrolearium]BDZ71461.1 hypothetical protein GCM10025861_19780 [Methanobacterium petrolearium]BDZ72024.1 hypothetical protein GCM10025861_25410 [Methanobacterium petrolearium]BDZ72085.1 hypothetical protein GCM10025861_26020 [Methanobacterium petrolearium]
MLQLQPTTTQHHPKKQPHLANANQKNKKNVQNNEKNKVKNPEKQPKNKKNKKIPNQK